MTRGSRVCLFSYEAGIAGGLLPYWLYVSELQSQFRAHAANGLVPKFFVALLQSISRAAQVKYLLLLR